MLLSGFFTYCKNRGAPVRLAVKALQREERTVWISFVIFAL